MSKRVTKPNTNTRRRHTNSKLGCLNCKRKKIRCDENLPLCDSCSRGKQETCSYLSLSASEINRIRITHSLRDSQNKLINSDYRLPTSTSQSSSSLNQKDSSVSVTSTRPSSPASASTPRNHKSLPHNSPKLLYHKKIQEDLGNALEFKLELSDLKLKIPTMSYPPLHYNILTINDFDKEFNVVEDNEMEQDQDDSAQSIAITTLIKPVNNSSSGDESDDSDLHARKILAFGFIKPTKFPKIKHVHNPRNSNNTAIEKINNFILNHNEELINHSLIVLGQVIVLNEMKSTRKYNPIKFSEQLIDSTERKCLERFEHLLISFEAGMNQLHRSYKPSEDCLSLTLANYCLSYCNLLLNSSSESYMKLHNNILKIFNIHSKLNPQEPNVYTTELSSMINKDIICINLPSYDPKFIVEMIGTLDKFQINIFKLEDVYKFKLNEKLNHYYNKLVIQYYSLVKFLKLDLLPIIQSCRDEKFISTYPSSVILTLLKKWYLTFPRELISFNSKMVPNPNSFEGLYLKDVTICLYMYYNCVSAILDSIFPASNYLFNLTFNFNELFENELVNCYFSKYMIVDKTNPLTNSSKKLVDSFKISDFLQRNNFLTNRIYSFFKIRHKFLTTYIIRQDFLSHNPDLSIERRLKSRVLKNYLEIPIANFNNTLIRPEHYPTSIHSHYDVLLRDKLVNMIYTRVDDIMNRKMFSRNIETLNFFQPNCFLQFDYSSKFLLNDYRNSDEIENAAVTETSPFDLKNHLFDRHLILLNDKM